MNAEVPAMASDGTFNVMDYPAFGSDDTLRFTAAQRACGAAGLLLVPPGLYSIQQNLTLTSAILFRPGAVLRPAAGKAITFRGAFDAPATRVFDTSLHNPSVTFGVGAVERALVQWWGFNPGDSDAARGRALKAAIASNAPVVALPNGTYGYDDEGAPVVISRAIRFGGTGSCGGGATTGNATASTTQLVYTGSGVALTLDGIAGEGVENIHLHDFSLHGSSSAAGGLLLGTQLSGHMIMKGSLRNVHVSGFARSRSPLGYGVRFGQVIEFLLENVYCQNNHDGFVNLPGDVATTLRVIDCHARTNTRFGINLAGTYLESVSFGWLAEGNGTCGLKIGGSGATVANVDFFGYYSEANGSAVSPPRLPNVPPVQIGLTDTPGRVSYINFFGGMIADVLDSGTPAFDVGACDNATWNQTRTRSSGPGFIRVTEHTVDCVFTLPGASIYPGLTGGAPGPDCLRMNTGTTPQTVFIPSLPDGRAHALPYTAGIVFVTDVTNNMSALFSLDGSARTTTLWQDPASHFSTTPGVKVSIGWRSGYVIQNSTGAAIQLLIQVLSPDFRQ